MSDTTALAQKLQAFISNDDVFEAGARVISDLGSPAPLFAILREIDDTVLERALSFSSGSTTVELIAAGRRLRVLKAVRSDSAIDTAVIGQTISREDPDTLDMAKALLTAAIDPIERLTVRSLTADPFGANGERGVPAADLMELWGVDATESAGDVTGTPVERFLKMNAAGTKAMLHVTEGAIVAQEGETADLERIWAEQSDAFVAAQAKHAKGPDGPRMFTIDGALSDGSGVTLIVADAEVALLAHDIPQLGKLHRTWQAIFG